MTTTPNSPESHPKKNWYVLANRSESVIYASDAREPMRFIARLENPAGKLTEKELTSDRPGRGASSAGNGSVRHGLDKREHQHEKVAREFAKQVAIAIDQAVAQHAMEDWVLVAEPKFLGLIRRSLSGPAKKRLAREVPLEMTRGMESELVQRLNTAV